MPLGIRPTVDFVFKMLFGSLENVDVLIHLLNSVLQPEHPIEEVEILNPYNDKSFEEDKLSIVDVKARDSSGAWYVIEVQTSLPAGLDHRLVYYTSELYAGQLREGDSYGDLCPAVSICFLTESLFREVPAGHLRFTLCDPAHSVSLGDQLQVHLIELAKYDLEEDELSDADWLERWVYFLTDSENRDADELRRLLPAPMFQKATGILEMIARSPELRLKYDDRAKEEKDRFSMVKDARAEGRVEGRVEGEVRGKLIGQIQAFEHVLGVAVTNEATLSTMEPTALLSLVSDLEKRIQKRS